MVTEHSGRVRATTGGQRGPAPAPRRRPGGARRSFFSPMARRVAHYVTMVLGPIVLLSLAAALLGYVRLLHGPVSLKAFSDRIEASINGELDGFKAQIDDAVITLADDYRVELRLINLRINEADGDLVASAPMAAVELNKPALWRLAAAPERVWLIEPRLAVDYSDDHGFTLSISEAPPVNDDGTPVDLPPPPAPVPAVRPAQRPANAVPAFHRVDLARILAESSARARRSSSSAPTLKEFGIRNATLSVTYAGKTSELHVAEASVDLARSKQSSVISGSATLASEKGPWSLAFRTDETARRDLVRVSTSVHGLVPSTLGTLSPGMALLDMLDAPVDGELSLELSTKGDLRSAKLRVDLGHGFVRLPSVTETPLMLDSGRLAVSYDGAARRFTIEPTSLDWGGSRMTVEGAITSDSEPAGDPQWHFGLTAIDGALSAEEFGVAAMPIEHFKAAGRVIPAEGLVQLSDLSLKVGGGELTANGEIISGSGSPSTRLEAALSPMPLAALKAMWPRAAAPGAREWVGTQVTKASLQSATLKLLSGRFLDTEAGAEPAPGPVPRQRLSASIEIAELRMQPLPRSLPIEAPRAVIRLENSALEVTVADAAIVAGDAVRLPLNSVRFTVVDVTHEAPVAELAFKANTSLAALVETLNRSQLHLAGKGPLPIEGIDGKVDGELKISMPLVSSATIVKADGKAHITDIKGRSKEHKLELQGGTVDLSVSDIGVIAKGDLIVNGVPTKLQMHRILDAEPQMQPPLRISATLDNSDRTQLGLDVNHLAQGNMGVEVTVAQRADDTIAVHTRADLTNTELVFSDLAWRKPPGRAATLDFDVVPTDAGTVELQNFKLVGENIAIDGSLLVDAQREVSQFTFPNFSLNVVSRLSVTGTLNDKRIWKIDAKGSTFDAKDFFRSLIALGKPTEEEIKPLRPAAGVDLSANIDTVLGHSDVSLRTFSLKLSERSYRIVGIQAQGTLDGGKPLTVALNDAGERKLYADSTDAGQAFKLIGFYPNVQGGRLKLEVDLEGRGAAEKSGVLWVENFRVLGDPIISEVYSNAETGPGQKIRKIDRETFDFQAMKAPFSVGHGQFVLGDSYLRGPLLGASIRGKVDFNTQRLNLGGTYVPLQGINSALCEIPLFGPIVSGLDCQGVFGLTYSIEGRMSQPVVYVNPLSMFTPGILRGIMEMTSPNPQVRPMPENARASSTGGGSSAEAIDGWSSETTPTKSEGARKKKK